MITFDRENRALKEALLDCIKADGKIEEVDLHICEFGDFRYRLQILADNTKLARISLRLPPSSPDVISFNGLPSGAIEAVKNAYSSYLEIASSPDSDYHLTLLFDFDLLPLSEDERLDVVRKISSIRSVVSGAPLHEILLPLANGRVAESADKLIAVTHKPKESFYLLPQNEKVTVVFPLRFKHSDDAVLANAFLQEFMEARRTGNLNSSPPCSFSPSPPMELKELNEKALDANAGFVSFVIFPHHVEGDKLDSLIWSLITFYGYVNYHIKCSKAFMHSGMRKRIESLIQVLNRAKLETEKETKEPVEKKIYKDEPQLRKTNKDEPRPQNVNKDEPQFQKMNKAALFKQVASSVVIGRRLSSQSRFSMND